MNRLAATLILLPSFLTLPVLAASTAPAPSSTPPGSTSVNPGGVPTPADIDAAAVRLAGALGGVLRNCPAAYAAVGTPDKRCLGLSGDVDAVRGQLSSALGSDLYGVWRSRDDQRTVFNWIKAPSGTVYLRVTADLTNPKRSLVYLDAPTVQASDLNTVGTPASSAPPTTPSTQTRPAPTKTPATETVTTPSAATALSPAQTGGVTITRPVRNLAPLPFRRTLELRSPRLNGPDVLAAQNRLIVLTLGSGPGKGDGWYGPNTARAVRDFQSANGLSASGKIDKATWDALFSSEAKGFKAGR